MSLKRILFRVISELVTWYHMFVFRKAKVNSLKLIRHYSEILENHEIDMMLSMAGLKLFKISPKGALIGTYEVYPIKPSFCADDSWIRYTPKNAWLYVARDKVDSKGFSSFIYAVIEQTKVYKKKIKMLMYYGRSVNPLFTFSPVFLINDNDKEFNYGVLPGRFCAAKEKDTQILAERITRAFVKCSCLKIRL